MATLGENVSRAIADFNAIKSAIASKGVVVGNSPTSAYAEKIASIKGDDTLFKDMITDNIESLAIPDGIRKIRDYCFYHWNTLALGSTNLAKLNDEDIAIATNKNWTLA